MIKNCGGSKTPINIEGEKGIVLGAVAGCKGVGETLGIEPSVGIGGIEFAHNGSDGLVFENSIIGEVKIRGGLVRVGEDEDRIPRSGHAANP